METQDLSLVIGDKNWSSWSLRPWLVLKRFQIPFDEISVQLRQPDTKKTLLAHSPSGKVPILKHGKLLIWDSLAIIEYLADCLPEKPIWPKSREMRALARAVSAEMHAGFQPLREQCPMDILSTQNLDKVPVNVEHNLRRIVQIFCEFRAKYAPVGPFLFGEFSAADAMYAPVCSRIRTYIPDLTQYGDDGCAQEFVSTIFKMPEIKEWTEGAKMQTKA